MRRGAGVARGRATPAAVISWRSGARAHTRSPCNPAAALSVRPSVRSVIRRHTPPAVNTFRDTPRRTITSVTDRSLSKVRFKSGCQSGEPICDAILMCAAPPLKIKQQGLGMCGHPRAVRNYVEWLVARWLCLAAARVRKNFDPNLEV